MRLVSALALLAAFPGASQGQKPKPHYDRDLITQEEIKERAPAATDAFEVVRQLRPHFLRERTTGTMAEGSQRQPVQVYIDGVLNATRTAALRDIRAELIIEIKYLNPSDATSRYGTGHMNGAILVATGK